MQTFLEYSRRGARVLALGIKEFGQMDAQRVRDLKREDVESNLTFAGFVVISCPIKPDSKCVIKELIHASHKVIMITGDNPLTACYVAKELRFTRKKLLILTRNESTNEKYIEWQWVSIDAESVYDLKHELKDLLSGNDLCVTGEGLQYLREQKKLYLLKILPHITVCARFAPKQKEYVITSLKHLGYYTLMCGDGTNDVGALKHAHVGVSLLSNGPTKLKKRRGVTNGTAYLSGSSAVNVRNIGSIRNAVTGASNTMERLNLSHRDRVILRHKENLNITQARLQSELKDIYDETSVVKLGDASIAAPFTSKTSSIACGTLHRV